MRKTPEVGTKVSLEGSVGTYVVARIESARTVVIKKTQDMSVLLTGIDISRLTPVDASLFNGLRREHYLLPVEKYKAHLAECKECDVAQNKLCENGRDFRDDAGQLDKEVP
jgi:hypothetical protein